LFNSKYSRFPCVELNTFYGFFNLSLLFAFKCVQVMVAIFLQRKKDRPPSRFSTLKPMFEVRQLKDAETIEGILWGLGEKFCENLKLWSLRG